MLWTRRALALLLLAAPIGCKSKEGRGTDASAGSASPLGDRGLALGSATPRPASSLATKNFLDRGMPSPDRAWSAKDYKAATDVLRGLKPDAYPLRGDAKSGAVFARFVADDNLAFGRNATISLDARFPEAIDALAASRALSGLYIEALQHGLEVGPETLALFQYLFAQADSLLDMSDAFLRTLNPKDPKYAVRIDGATRVVEGLGEMALGAAMTLSEKQTYATDDLRAFSDGLRTTLPKIVARLDATHRKDVVDRITDARDKETDPAYKASLRDLLQAIEKEPPKTFVPAATEPP